MVACHQARTPFDGAEILRKLLGELGQRHWSKIRWTYNAVLLCCSDVLGLVMRALSKHLLALCGPISSCLVGMVLQLDCAFSTLVSQFFFPSRIASCQHTLQALEAADCMLEWRKRILRAVRSCLDFCSHA